MDISFPDLSYLCPGQGCVFIIHMDLKKGIIQSNCGILGNLMTIFLLELFFEIGMLGQNVEF